MRHRYEEIEAKHGAALKSRRRQFSALGYGKLALLLIFLYCVYHLIWRHATPVGIILTAILFVLLLCLWVLHLRVEERVHYHEGILAANERYFARLRMDWEKLPEDGHAHLPAEHPYAEDLDIVGEASVYQWLNTANTWHGRKTFAGDLLDAAYDVPAIEKRQEAIRDLASKPEFLNRVQYYAGKTGASAEILPVLEVIAKKAPAKTNPILRAACMAVPLAAVCLLLLSVLLQIPVMRIVALCILSVQAVVWVVLLPKITRYLSPFLKCPAVLEHYAKAMEAIAEEPFSASLLRDIQSTLGGETHSAIRAIKKLDGYVSRVHLRSNPVVYLLANVLLLWDVQCVMQLLRWQETYGAACEKWFESLGVFESLMSFSGLLNVCEGTSFPVVAPEEKLMEAEALGHPLIPNAARVCNDLRMENEIFLLTGSNMSGKTTFLRTIGVNLVLAYAGAPVCTARMRCGRFRVMSSMRITDNLEKGLSSFYAELKKIKKILDAARLDPHVFFLIDEIFRGTNSEDRHDGAKAVITELGHLHTMGLLTTHDLALCELTETLDHLENYHFSESYEGEQVRFDYRFRAGKAPTTNGKFLMRQVGLLKDSEPQGD